MNINLIGLNRNTRTAGPGTRLEYFTKGCIRGVLNPCAGCFNEETWTFSGDKRTMTTTELAEHAITYAYNGLITFCGGEPMIQARAILDTVKQIKQGLPNAHIIMYTAYRLDSLMKHGLSFTWKEQYGDDMKFALNGYSELIEIDEEKGTRKYLIVTPELIHELMSYVDVIVDGDYQADKRLTNSQYMHDGWFIGSANQRVIFTKETLVHRQLIYRTAEDYNYYLQHSNLCEVCGKPITGSMKVCSSECMHDYERYIKPIQMEGIK